MKRERVFLNKLLELIPGRVHNRKWVLIHGRYDVSSPLETAWRLSKHWVTSQLHVINDAGHGGGETLAGATVNALTQFSA